MTDISDFEGIRAHSAILLRIIVAFCCSSLLFTAVSSRICPFQFLWSWSAVRIAKSLLGLPKRSQTFISLFLPNAPFGWCNSTQTPSFSRIAIAIISSSLLSFCGSALMVRKMIFGGKNIPLIIWVIILIPSVKC